MFRNKGKPSRMHPTYSWSSADRQLQHFFQWQSDKVVFQQEYLISPSKAGQDTS